MFAARLVLALALLRNGRARDVLAAPSLLIHATSGRAGGVGSSLTKRSGWAA